MEEEAAPLWHIDALDARAGHAFAAWRAADLHSENLAVDAPGVFIGPPSFSPEAVSSRAVGLAATRASAQLGLVVDETEVGFATLGELAEFVRRLYLGGGGGDGGGGIGPGVPPLPEGGGPEFPYEGGPAEPDAAVSELLTYSRNFGDTISDLKVEAGSPVSTKSFRLFLTSPAGTAAAFSLREGAALLVFEMMKRVPSNGSEEDFLSWRHAAFRLGRAVAKFGLWWDVLDRLHATIDPFAAQLRSSRMVTRLDLHDRYTDAPWVIPMLFGVGLDNRGYRPDRPYWLPFHWQFAGAFDPVSDLALFPTPTGLVCLPRGAGQQTSVLDMLCAVTASPDLIKKDLIQAQRTAELLFFAAAYLAAPDAHVSDYSSRRLAFAEQRRATQAGIAWLADQFPKRAFPYALEDAIKNSALLRYA